MLATKQPQLHSQLEPNPNNKQQAYSLQVNDIHLRFGTKLPPPKEPIITKVIDTKNGLASQLVNVPISPSVQAPNPPFPQRLVPTTPSKPSPVATNLLDQLKKMTI